VSDKKERIRIAAIELFACRGFHRSTTDEIAAAADVAVGTIYNYFRSKQDILDHIFLTEHAKRQAVYERMQRSQLNPVHKLRTIIAEHFDEVRKNPDLVMVILREGHNVGPQVREKEGLRRFLSAIIREGTESGKIRPVDEEICATMMFGAVRGIMRDFSERQEKGDCQPEIFNRALEQMMDLVHHGLAGEK